MRRKPRKLTRETVGDYGGAGDATSLSDPMKLREPTAGEYGRVDLSETSLSPSGPIQPHE